MWLLCRTKAVCSLIKRRKGRGAKRHKCTAGKATGREAKVGPMFEAVNFYARQFVFKRHFIRLPKPFALLKIPESFWNVMRYQTAIQK